MDENIYPGSLYQNLFNYLHEEHGLTLLESEMNDLINVVHKFHPAEAAWVKADTKPEHNVGVLVFIPGEDNHITSGMWDISNKWVLLDEYRTPEEEVTHWMPLPAFPDGYTWNEIPDELAAAIKKVAEEELGKFPVKIPEESGMEFAEWALNEGWESRKGKGWMKHSDETPYVLTTAQLYEYSKNTTHEPPLAQ